MCVSTGRQKATGGLIVYLTLFTVIVALASVVWLFLEAVSRCGMFTLRNIAAPDRILEASKPYLTSYRIFTLDLGDLFKKPRRLGLVDILFD